MLLIIISILCLIGTISMLFGTNQDQPFSASVSLSIIFSCFAFGTIWAFIISLGVRKQKDWVKIVLFRFFIIPIICISIFSLATNLTGLFMNPKINMDILVGNYFGLGMEIFLIKIALQKTSE